MDQQHQEIFHKNALQPLPKDLRDIKLGALYPDNKDPSVLPESFRASGGFFGIKNQASTDFCTAFATIGASERQENIELDPVFTMMATKIIDGHIESFGANLRDAAKSHKEYGALEKKDAVFTIGNDRTKILTKSNWPDDLFEKAKEHKKESFIMIEPYGKVDLFDAIRFAMWDGRIKSQEVVTGAYWKADWNKPDGVIPKTYSSFGMPHAFRFDGWDKINGELYLHAILSNGHGIGKQGEFWMPRIVANRELVYGSLIFNDVNPEELQRQLGIYYQILSAIQEILNVFGIIIKQRTNQ